MQLPSDLPEYWSLTHNQAHTSIPVAWSNVQPFIHIIKLDRIQSRIQKTMFRVDKDVVRGTVEDRLKLDRKVQNIIESLEDWIRHCPQTPKNDNKSTWMYDPESAFLDARDFYGV